MLIDDLKRKYASSESSTGYKYLYKMKKGEHTYWFVNYRSNGDRITKTFKYSEEGLAEALMWMHEMIMEGLKPTKPLMAKPYEDYGFITVKIFAKNGTSVRCLYPDGTPITFNSIEEATLYANKLNESVNNA